MQTNIESLERLTLAIEAQGVDIAPEYQEYITVANAIATDCGEAGRTFFHRICRFSHKYKPADAEKDFSNWLKTNKDKVHLGSLFHLAEQAGVKTGAGAMHPAPPYTRAENSKEEEVGEDPEENPDPKKPLPHFAEYEWPEPLRSIVEMGDNPSQKDILLLGALTVLGATLERHVRILYGGKMIHPCLQTFVIAPPASGKGVISLLRQLVEPIHYEIRDQVEKQMAVYQKEKSAYDYAGRERANMEIPKKAANRMFLISGNNTGTGILQNIMDADGTGLILEVEADTISAAIGAEYGHWSDTLRKCFDHDALTYNRRTNEEYREVRKSFLSILLSGTPGQIKPLIPSAENGLFSRQLFYYMTGIREWKDQFDVSDTDLEEEFRKMGWQWKERVKEIRERNLLTLKLTKEQKVQFNTCFSQIFQRSGLLNGNEMNSSVARLATNLCRILCVVAVLRGEMKADSTIPYENVKDGLAQRWDMSISDDDFQAVMGMAEPLYAHATHILSYLPGTDVQRRTTVVRDDFFTALPKHFTRRDVSELAERLGLNRETVKSWLGRLKRKGAIVSDAEGYTLAHTYARS